ncbi:hypothetical protein BD311DRAFT_237338 [Dichomitus squalens]|uniref:Uncharacterized protein n=1 Tax=Dichomitus squalens TaxID=114155 RepID=A0A4Q9M716_9APHY|nr:hypothetical protein BD311DRAFT_237338 [Dichomitus squalens]
MLPYDLILHDPRSRLCSTSCHPSMYCAHIPILCCSCVLLLPVAISYANGPVDIGSCAWTLCSRVGRHRLTACMQIPMRCCLYHRFVRVALRHCWPEVVLGLWTCSGATPYRAYIVGGGVCYRVGPHGGHRTCPGSHSCKPGNSYYGR